MSTDANEVVRIVPLYRTGNRSLKTWEEVELKSTNYLPHSNFRERTNNNEGKFLPSIRAGEK